jgi:hypothetical protein
VQSEVGVGVEAQVKSRIKVWFHGNHKVAPTPTLTNKLYCLSSHRKNPNFISLLLPQSICIQFAMDPTAKRQKEDGLVCVSVMGTEFKCDGEVQEMPHFEMMVPKNWVKGVPQVILAPIVYNDGVDLGSKEQAAKCIGSLPSRIPFFINKLRHRFTTMKTLRPDAAERVALRTCLEVQSRVKYAQERAAALKDKKEGFGYSWQDLKVKCLKIAEAEAQVLKYDDPGAFLELCEEHDTYLISDLFFAEGVEPAPLAATPSHTIVFASLVVE